MIVRNSVKSIYRTPVKSFFYVFMIATVTALLYLGINTWVASTAMQADLDKNHISITIFEYLDNYGSVEGERSETMLSEVGLIDFDLIAGNENVILWQPADEGMGTSPGYVSNALIPEYDYSFVFIVTGLRFFEENSPYHGRLVETLYSYRNYENGRSVFINFSYEYADFEVDPDALYVVHATNHRVNANGLSVELTPFYSSMAERAGVDTAAIPQIMEIESVEAFLAEEDNVYVDISQYYSAMSNAVTVVAAEDIANLEPFHQNHLKLSQGRLFTPEESQAGAKLAVISSSLANKLELEIGDEITVNLPDDEYAPMYNWGDEMTREDQYSVVGILDYHAEYTGHIFVSQQAETAIPQRYMHRLGQATIINGQYDDFMSEIESTLPERVSVKLFDQGYQTTADSLIVIQNAAMVFSLIAVMVTLAVLAFFSNLFMNLHRESLDIMRSFGAKKRELALHYLIAAGIIAVLGIGGGLAAGMYFAEGLITTAYEFVSDLQVVDLRYSDSFRGLVKPFTPVATLSYRLAVILAGSILIVLLLTCFYFAKKSLGKRLITARVRVLRAPKRSSVALSGSLRYAYLSLRRGGTRSLLIPILSITIFLFVGSMQATMNSYDQARDNLYANTDLSGYVSTTDGRFTDRLSLRPEIAADLLSISQFDDAMYTYRFNYGYQGVTQYANGEAGDAEPVSVPNDFFAYEIFINTLRAGPNLLLTNNVADAPEFYFTGFQADFMDGWDIDRFNSREWDALPALVTQQFMAENKLEYGDTIRIYSESPIPDTGMLAEMDLMIVGSFNRASNYNNIYAPLPNDTQESETDDPGTGIAAEGWLYYSDGEYISTSGTLYHLQEYLSLLLNHKQITSMRFKIEDTTEVTKVKDILEGKGYSSPNLPNSLPVSVVIEDSQFNESLSSIAQRSQYMKILYQVLLVLVAILALIMGFLSVNNRREDIALMRGMGTPKRRIFGSIFLEQLLLVLIGTIPAAGVWLLGTQGIGLDTIGVYIYGISYLVSVGLSLVLQNAKSAQSILSERE